ncbi:hypothetical protein [Glutamicibacter endophyticus]|uniref:hypothetical protein n=1 Tax=Glutamicibacter endophyticus TaxID=1522174 RepID=UPI003AF0377B
MDTSPDQNQAALVKSKLHEAFDQQIPNFASYNLVAAIGIAGSGGLKVVGYRRQPAELVLAPVKTTDLSASEAAITINNTNVNQLAIVNDGAYEIATSTGRTFRFSIPRSPSVDLHLDDAVVVAVEIEQADDAADFADFMDHFMNTVEGTENFI